MLKEKTITRIVEVCDMCGKEISHCVYPFTINRNKIFGFDKVSQNCETNILKQILVGAGSKFIKKDKTFQFHLECVEQAVFEKMKKNQK
jgi:hypothetical protein